MTDTEQRARELLAKNMVTNWLTSAESAEFVAKADALRALTTLITRLDDVTYAERVEYERRILSAECGTQRILNDLRAKLKWAADQFRTNRDAFDPQAASTLDIVMGWIGEVDVTDHSATRPADDQVEAVARAICLVHGQDPDDMAWRGAICGPNSEPLPLWHYYEEDARAAIAAALPKPGDPDLIEARKIAAAAGGGWEADYDSGRWDRSHGVDAALRGIKRGRELERGQ